MVKYKLITEKYNGKATKIQKKKHLQLQKSNMQIRNKLNNWQLIKHIKIKLTLRDKNML